MLLDRFGHASALPRGRLTQTSHLDRVGQIDSCSPRLLTTVPGCPGWDDEAEQRAALAARTINAQLQHTDAVTVLAMALERHTLAMDAYRAALDRHAQALSDFDPRLH